MMQDVNLADRDFDKDKVFGSCSVQKDETDISTSSDQMKNGNEVENTSLLIMNDYLS